MLMAHPAPSPSPVSTTHLCTLPRPYSVSSPAPIEADGELPNQCLTSELNLGAIPWQQRSTRETLHHEAKAKNTRMLEQSHSNRSEPDKGGEEFLEMMKRLAIDSLLPRSKMAVFGGNPLRFFVFIRSFENNVEKDTNDFLRK